MVDLSFYRKVQESIDGCIKCGLCLTICPTFEVLKGGQFGGPRYLSAELQRHLMEFGKIAYDASYLCTICRHCEFVCPGNVATPAATLFLRQVLSELKLSAKPASDVNEGLKGMLEHGNPYFISSEMKGEWLEEIDGVAGGKAEIIGWVGCTSSIRLPELAQAFYQSLKKACGNDFTVLGSEEWCCGKPAFLLGGKDTAVKLASESINRIKKTGAKTLVTPCPACLSAFKYEYKEWYGLEPPTPKVLHYSEFVKELLDKGAISFRNVAGELPEKIIYHDPCELGRGLGIYDEPREVLEAIPGILVLEYDDKRENSKCCGGGGGMFGVYSDLSMAIAARKLKEALKMGAKALVSSCPACMLNFKYAAINYEIPIEVLDLSQVVEKAVSQKS